MGDRLTAALLGPLPGFGAALRLGPYHLAWLAREGLGSTAGFALRHFRTEAARRVIPALALHVDLGPDDFAGAGLGLVLALLASGPGFRIPVGGARVHHPCPDSPSGRGRRRTAAQRPRRAHPRPRRSGGCGAHQRRRRNSSRPRRSCRRGAAGLVPSLVGGNAGSRRDAAPYDSFPLWLGHIQDGLGVVRPCALDRGRGARVGGDSRRRQPGGSARHSRARFAAANCRPILIW